MKIHINEYIKILLVLLVLLFLLIIGVKIRGQKTFVPATSQTPTIAAKPTIDIHVGSFTLSADKTQVQVGEALNLTVSFDSLGKKLDGADAILRFDPKLITADKDLVMGTYFTTYPRKEVDNTAGVIKVTAFNIGNTEPVTASTVLFNVTFTAKVAGAATFNLDFDKTRTNLSTLVEQGTSQNILGKVIPATVIISK